MVGTCGYGAYGSIDEAEVTGIDKPDSGNPTQTEPYNAYRYNAKRWDAGSGTYDMGFRDYNPGLNRFTTRDMYNGALANMGLGTNPYTGNRYAFTAGNPVSGIEIDGHRFDTNVFWDRLATSVVESYEYSVGLGGSWLSCTGQRMADVTEGGKGAADGIAECDEMGDYQVTYSEMASKVSLPRRSISATTLSTAAMMKPTQDSLASCLEAQSSASQAVLEGALRHHCTPRRRTRLADSFKIWRRTNRK